MTDAELIDRDSYRAGTLTTPGHKLPTPEECFRREVAEQGMKLQVAYATARNPQSPNYCLLTARDMVIAEWNYLGMKIPEGCKE